jgi:alpha-tubulin suppressor-like RCC1 family protein
MSITSIANSIFDDNIYTLNSSVHSITNSITIANKQKLVIPPNFSLDIAGTLNIASGGALLNYGSLTIDGSLNSSGVCNNEAGSRLINNKSLSNSGVFINRGTFSNQTNANLVNSIGADFFNKNRGIINNSSQITNNGTFSNYSTLNNSKNFLNKAEGRVLNPYANNFFNSGAGIVVNYGQYINEINYASGTTIYPPYNLIAAGTNHSLGINYTTKQLYGWGDNSRKQLTTAGTSVNVPTLISLPTTSSTNWKYVEAGGNSSFGITDDSSNNLYVWGDNSGGHLGIDNSNITQVTIPQKIFFANTNKKWIGAASGLNHLLALDSNNTLYSCGDNTYGQLGYKNIVTDTSINVVEAGLRLQPASSSDYPVTCDGSLNFGIAGGNNIVYSGFQSFGAYVTLSGYSVKNGDIITIKAIKTGSTQYSADKGADGYAVFINNKYIAIAGGAGGGAGGYGGNAGINETITGPANNLYSIGEKGGGYSNNQGESGPTGGEGGGGNYGGGGISYGAYSYNGIAFNISNGTGGDGGGNTWEGFGSAGSSGGGGFGGGGAGSYRSNGGGGGSFVLAGGNITNNITNQPLFMNITNVKNVIPSTALKQIGHAGSVVQLSCGDNHSLAIDVNGDLWTVGNNSSGQLGYVTQTATQNIPQKVANPNPAAKWIKAVGGSNHSLGLQSDGSIYELKLKSDAMTVASTLNSGIQGNVTTSFLSLDGTIGYFGTDQGYIYKVHLNNNNMVLDPISIVLPGYDIINTSFISGTTGYFGGRYGIIYKVNLNNMTILSSLPFNNNIICTSFLSSNPSFGYFGLYNGNNSVIVKVDLNNFSYIFLNITLPDYLTTSFLSLDGTTGYFGSGSVTNENSSGYIYKVNLNTVVLDSSLNFVPNSQYLTSFMSKDGTTGYFCLIPNFLIQGNKVIYKVDLNSMSLISTLTTPESLTCSFLSKDYNIGYFGGSSIFYSVNLTTMKIINSLTNSNMYTNTSFLSLDGTTGYFGGASAIYKVNLPPIQSLTKITAPALTWIDIAAGANVSLALSSENKLYAWGSDISGQLGLGTPNGTTYTTPQLISAAPTHFLNSCVGESHTLSIGKNDGNLYAWGTNTTGQLGHNNTTNSYTPQLVLSSNLNPIV